MSLQKAMRKERDRLDNEIKILASEVATINTKIASLKKELNAIVAYERARTGTTAKVSIRQSVKQSDVLNKLMELGQAVKAELVDAFDVKDDTAGQKSLSNALSNLKKSEKIIQDDKKVYKPSN
jgi:hypothetical protein